MIAYRRVTNKFYVAGQERAARVKDLFAAIAPRYDLINDLQSFGLHRWWKRRLLKLAAGQPGERALDLCCGTGDIALALARQGLQVTGLDFSEQMLAVAERRAGELGYGVSRLVDSGSLVDAAHPLTPALSPDGGEGGRQRADQPAALTAERNPSGSLAPIGGEGRGEGVRNAKGETFSNRKTSAPSIRFIRGDAQQLPFPDNAFDVITIGYGLRNLADMQTGLREMQRVLRPGGRLLILDFGKPDNAAWRWLYFTYLRCCVPLMGRLFFGDADTHGYILESLLHYAAQRGVDAKLRELGLTQTRVINLVGGVMSINYAVKPK